MQAILFDLDGVIYQGDHALPGAAETLAWVRREGIPHLFVTNTSSRPPAAIVAKLAAMGITVPAERLLTPPEVARGWLVEQVSGPVALFVAPGTAAAFDGLATLGGKQEQGAAAVVIGDMGDGWTYAALNRALRLLLDGEPPLVALGMTRCWRAADGLRLDVGAMVSALSYATGREPVVLGKPSPGFYQAALERLGADAGEVLMIGDDILGDVQGAQRAGLRGGLVRTGKFRPTDLEQGIAPDLVLDDVGGLPAWWHDHQAAGD